MGKPVIMGRRTFESIGKPLDGRENIVITRATEFAAAGVVVTHSLADAVRAGRAAASRSGVDEIMIIGGAEIYAAALPIADRIYLTRVHATVEGDTVLPALDPGEWREVGSEPIKSDPRDEHQATLLVLERVPATSS